MRGALDLGTSLLYAQVKKANSDHKVEPESNLLRSKHFHVGKPVYLGNVAIRLISQLSQPDTPFFVQPPSFNEQVWQLTCKSSSISISVDSSSYWGAGLFNSGYLNRIEITGPLQERARIIFDLVATLSHNPWEFSHLRSARKMLHKESISLEGNEKSWRNLMQVASSNMEERIAVLAERTNKVDKRVTMNKNKKGFDHKMSNASLQSAIHDLEVARAAHADDNSPAVERALARVEASLINADPSSQIESDEQLLQDELPDGHILPIDDDENVDIVDLSESEEDAEVLTEKDVIIAGMSQIIEEE
ncbi:MAG: hypothetical protein HOE79_04105 [Euryarchaeota archaeon]|jgi:hypothetical protein|nr:hypothetical protein [Euryarchaeota archaeon]